MFNVYALLVFLGLGLDAASPNRSFIDLFHRFRLLYNDDRRIRNHIPAPLLIVSQRNKVNFLYGRNGTESLRGEAVKYRAQTLQYEQRPLRSKLNRAFFSRRVADTIQTTNSLLIPCFILTRESEKNLKLVRALQQMYTIIWPFTCKPTAISSAWRRRMGKESLLTNAIQTAILSEHAKPPAFVVDIPCIHTRHAESYSVAKAALSRILKVQSSYGDDQVLGSNKVKGDYEYLVLTSAEGAKGFLESWRSMSANLNLMPLKIVSIGPSVSTVLEKWGITPVFEPTLRSASSIGTDLLLGNTDSASTQPIRVLIATSNQAPTVLQDILGNRKDITFSVDRIDIYSTEMNSLRASEKDIIALLSRMVESGDNVLGKTYQNTDRSGLKCHIVPIACFASPSAVISWCNQIKLKGFVASCIGPTTFAKASEYSLFRRIVAPPHSGCNSDSSLSGWVTYMRDNIYKE